MIILLEYTCFPIFSEILLPFCGIISSLNNISFLNVFSLSLVAGIFGALICYAIGYLGGYKFINIISGRFPVVEEKLNKSFVFFNKYGSITICIGRLFPLVRTYISFVAGITRQNLVKYMIFSTLGIGLWNFILIWFGYQLLTYL